MQRFLGAARGERAHRDGRRGRAALASPPVPRGRRRPQRRQPRRRPCSAVRCQHQLEDRPGEAGHRRDAGQRLPAEDPLPRRSPSASPGRDGPRDAERDGGEGHLRQRRRRLPRGPALRPRKITLASAARPTPRSRRRRLPPSPRSSAIARPERLARHPGDGEAGPLHGGGRGPAEDVRRASKTTSARSRTSRTVAAATPGTRWSTLSARRAQARQERPGRWRVRRRPGLPWARRPPARLLVGGGAPGRGSQKSPPHVSSEGLARPGPAHPVRDGAGGSSAASRAPAATRGARQHVASPFGRSSISGRSTQDHGTARPPARRTWPARRTAGTPPAAEPCCGTSRRAPARRSTSTVAIGLRRYAEYASCENGYQSRDDSTPPSARPTGLRDTEEEEQVSDRRAETWCGRGRGRRPPARAAPGGRRASAWTRPRRRAPPRAPGRTGRAPGQTPPSGPAPGRRRPPPRP